MPKRIYIGNLPPSASDREIRRMCGRYGKVVGVVIRRGTAAVDMADAASARQAMKALHQTDMGGKSLNVNEARP